MEASKSQSIFHGIRSRELNGFRVRKRPYFNDLALDFTEIGALAIEHDGDETPPMAVSFCKASKNSHVFAVSDEDGYVNLFDSGGKFSSSSSRQDNAVKARIADWVAHQNAIFDICWIKEDTSILTASGDQTIRVWDAHEKKCTGVLTGHTGSVKSLSSHPANSDIIISGSRDGSFALWDLRCKISSKSRCKEDCISSTAMVKRAHVSPQARRVKRVKAASMSITSVLYLKDEISIATAGAVDSVVKFWDIRNLKTHVTQARPYQNSSTQKERSHGISSLSQDLNGVFLTASCMDNRIYLYNILQLDKGPIQTFSGCQIGSFYVKSAISPDATHILSGSSDGNAYVWRVNKPQAEPTTLRSHDGEVTAVDWCPSEMGKIATSADDFTVRLWDMESSFSTSIRSPSSVRRRVMAIPSSECRKLVMNEYLLGPTKDPGSSHPEDEVLHQIKSSRPTPNSILCTPEAQKKRISLPVLDSTENFEKTPETASKSPSSVLNPPSSSKRRTIRDYFLVSP
ncbi:hypothetical protein SLA2020_066320 [Shorea laevis]